MTQENTKMLKREQLLELPIEEQRDLMLSWRKEYTVNQICEETGIPKGGSMYNYLRYLGIPTVMNGGTKKDVGISTLNFYERKNSEKNKEK